MQLRDDPLMSYRGLSNWPPVWTRIRGGENKHPNGEVGILREVLWSTIQLRPRDSFFLGVEYGGTVYMGCLLFDRRLLSGVAALTTRLLRLFH
jgi:hypothetical protein